MSTVDARPHPHGTSTGRQRIRDLVGRRITDVFKLVENERALATFEMKQHLESLAHTSVMFLIGGFSATIGVLLLATAAALGVGDEIGSLIGGYVVGGAAITVIGAIVIGVARSRLSRQSRNPIHTIDEIRRDVTWLSHEAMRRRA